VNKYDLNLDMTEKIEQYCKDNNIDVIGKIPFDKGVVEAMVLGKTIIEYKSGQAKKAIEKAWQLLQKKIGVRED